MRKAKRLVLERAPVDALASRAVAGREVAALDHEILDDAVEGRALVAKAHRARAELLEVFRRARDVVAVEAHDDVAGRGASHGDVEEDLVGDVARVSRGGAGGEGAAGGAGGRRGREREPAGRGDRGG